jgi:hypothetical protein
MTKVWHVRVEQSDVNESWLISQCRKPCKLVHWHLAAAAAAAADLKACQICPEAGLCYCRKLVMCATALWHDLQTPARRWSTAVNERSCVLHSVPGQVPF